MVHHDGNCFDLIASIEIRPLVHETYRPSSYRDPSVEGAWGPVPPRGSQCMILCPPISGHLDHRNASYTMKIILIFLKKKSWRLFHENIFSLKCGFENSMFYTWEAHLSSRWSRNIVFQIQILSCCWVFNRLLPNFIAVFYGPVWIKKVETFFF